ncbi:MAG: AbrB/MazE/SpoVT family DNA-binding domain-containing protein [Halobacteria archaeon]
MTAENVSEDRDGKSSERRVETDAYSETTVNDSRSVTIPKEVCDKLDVKPGDKVRWRVTDDELSVEVVRQRHGAFEDFEPVDIGEETNAAEDHDVYGSL